MKLSGNFDVSGAIAKEDERYKVIDNTTLFYIYNDGTVEKKMIIE